MQAAVSHALAAYARLVEQNRADCAFPTVLARHAVGHVRDGRRIGTPQNSRDLLSRKAQLTKRFSVKQFSCFDRGSHPWSEAVLEDDRTPVPEQAAFRIDFPTWLALLSARDRRIAEQLAIGQTTSELAQSLGVSSARISQKRQELHTSWRSVSGRGDHRVLTKWEVDPRLPFFLRSPKRGLRSRVTATSARPGGPLSSATGHHPRRLGRSARLLACKNCPTISDSRVNCRWGIARESAVASFRVALSCVRRACSPRRRLARRLNWGLRLASRSSGHRI